MNIAIAQSQPSQFSSGQILAYLKQQVHSQWSSILSTYTDEQLVAINNDLVIAIRKRKSQKLNQTE